MKKMLLLLLIMQFYFGIQAQLNFEKLPELSGASIGYMVRDLHSGKLIASHDTSKVLAPASVLKLFTTAVALDELGGQKKVESLFYKNAKVENGVLLGDLFFDGNYNPTLLATRYNQSMDKLSDNLIASLKRKNIHTIKGDIKVIGDTDDVHSIPRTWIWEDIGNYYGAGLSRTVVNENILKIYLKSGAVGSKAEVLRIEPHLPWLIIDSEVYSSKVNKDLAYCFSRPGDKKITMTGTIPASRASFLVKASLPDPAGTFGILLKRALVKKGITVMGNPSVVGPNFGRIQILHSIYSPSISSIVRKTNKHSINIYAESLLNLAHTSHMPVSGNRTEYLKSHLGKHIENKSMKLYDGSGMSRFNAVSSKQVVDLISWMDNHKEKESFYGSFAVAGESGTLKSMLANTIAKGRIKGKSGSMDGVRAYAGTINTRSGENLAFSVIVNNYSIANSALKKIVEKWLWELWSNN